MSRYTIRRIVCFRPEVLWANKTTGTYHLLIETKNVPSLGYEVLHVSPGERHFASDLSAHGLTLENAYLRVVVDPKTGCITSLYDKQGKFETLAPGGCGNELEAFHDHPKCSTPGTFSQTMRNTPTI